MKRPANLQDCITQIARVNKHVDIARHKLHGELQSMLQQKQLDVPVEVAVIGAVPAFAWLSVHRNQTVITLRIIDFPDRTITNGLGAGFGMFLKLTIREITSPCFDGLILGLAEDFTLEQPAG